MAQSTSSRFPNAKVGTPQIAGPFNKFDLHANPQYNIGFKVELEDGTTFRYAHFGADVNRGVLVGTDESESSVADTDNVVIAPASANVTTDGTLGSFFVQITLASITAGDFQGGYFVTTDDLGEGFTYRIKGNNATGDPASGDIRLELYEPLQIALDATTDIAIQGSLYSNLEIATAATDMSVAGVTCKTMDVSAQEWGWIQTKGPVGCLQDATVIVKGDQVVHSSLTSGAYGAFGGTAPTVDDLIDEFIIGYVMQIGDTTGHGIINLMLE